MQVIQLTLSQIHIDKDFNVREKRNFGDVDGLAQQIVKDGQLNPIQVGTPISGTGTPSDGKYPLIAGFRRVEAIKKIARANGGEAAVFAVVVDKEESERAWINLAENVSRNDLTDYEKAKGLNRMVEQFGWKASRIAERFGITEDGEKVKGMSPSHIGNLVNAFGKLSPAALEAWSKGQLTTEGAFRLKTKAHDEQDLMLPYVKGKGGAALISAIDDYERGDEPEAVESADGKKKRSKPGNVAKQRCLAWAKEEGLDDIVAVFRWLDGKGGKTLKLSGGQVFDPKKTEETEE